MEDLLAELLDILLTVPVYLFLAIMLELYGPANFS